MNKRLFRQLLVVNKLPETLKEALVQIGDEELLDALLTPASKNHLTDEMFFKLLEQKNSGDLATRLASHANTGERIDSFLAKEKRANPVAAVLLSQDVTEKQFTAAVSSKKKLPKVMASAAAAHILRNKDSDFSAELRASTFRDGGFIGPLTEVLLEGMPVEEVTEIFLGSDTWASRLNKTSKARFDEVLSLRPELLDAFLAEGVAPGLIAVAAGSHLLDSQEKQDKITKRTVSEGQMVGFAYALISLAWNPRATEETLGYIEQAAQNIASVATSVDALRAVERLTIAVSEVRARGRHRGLEPLSSMAEGEGLQFYIRRNTGTFARQGNGERVTLLRNQAVSDAAALDALAAIVSSRSPALSLAMTVELFAQRPAVVAAFAERVRKTVDELFEYLEGLVSRDREILLYEFSHSASGYRLLIEEESDVSQTVILENAVVQDLVQGNISAHHIDLSVASWKLLIELLSEAETSDPLEELVLAADFAAS